MTKIEISPTDLRIHRAVARLLKYIKSGRPYNPDTILQWFTASELADITFHLYLELYKLQQNEQIQATAETEFEYVAAA